ncbi:hypothetical protein NPIL_76671 [Nephila pilipes]|uniref:Uncharacterized protein n=1 Tax=Nephila pilipes TaxID=299642 RepID=A0A8X6P3V2_NEPPI|nr:hypothetical protein NPIL_76671 [Nephila pilipes]
MLLLSNPRDLPSGFQPYPLTVISYFIDGTALFYNIRGVRRFLWGSKNRLRSKVVMTLAHFPGIAVFRVEENYMAEHRIVICVTKSVCNVDFICFAAMNDELKERIEVAKVSFTKSSELVPCLVFSKGIEYEKTILAVL